jgi:hypothetical protein
MDAFLGVPTNGLGIPFIWSVDGRLSRRPYEWIGHPFHLEGGWTPFQASLRGVEDTFQLEGWWTPFQASLRMD